MINFDVQTKLQRCYIYLNYLNYYKSNIWTEFHFTLNLKRNKKILVPIQLTILQLYGKCNKNKCNMQNEMKIFFGLLAIWSIFDVLDVLGITESRNLSFSVEKK